MKISVVGLGYVGVPLSVALSKKFDVIGFDVDKDKIEELKKGIDRTDEVESKELINSKIEFTADPKKIKDSEFIIVAVPTPITKAHSPDLKFLKSASEIVGQNISKGSIVVYESTVFPGATEEVCVPIIEKESGYKCGKDFKVGYSPERINPGDKVNTLEKIVKVIAGMDEETTDVMENVYGSIIDAGIFRATGIKTAEATKIMENIQRDVNIGLMNEFALIFHRLGIDTREVIEAASTKWNFHNYYPGLVGGHCIGIDPYYLTFKSQELGHEPQIIFSARNINEYMPKHVSELIIKMLASKALNKSKVLLLGLTFKDNVCDIRNSKAKDIIKELSSFDIEVIGCDPLINVKGFGIEICSVDDIPDIDCAVLLCAHDEFKELTLKRLKKHMAVPRIVDLKSFYDKKKAMELGYDYKSL